MRLSGFAPGEQPETLAAVAEDGRLQLWDIATSTLRQQLTHPTHLTMHATCIAWCDADGALLAEGSDTGHVLVWDTARAELLHGLRVNHGLPCARAHAFLT